MWGGNCLKTSQMEVKLIVTGLAVNWVVERRKSDELGRPFVF